MTNTDDNPKPESASQPEQQSINLEEHEPQTAESSIHEEQKSETSPSQDLVSEDTLDVEQTFEELDEIMQANGQKGDEDALVGLDEGIVDDSFASQYSGTDFDPPKKSATGKVLIGTVLLALLAVGTYYGLQVLPQLTGMGEINALEQAMFDRSKQMEQAFSGAPVEEEKTPNAPVVENEQPQQPMATQDLPVPADIVEAPSTQPINETNPHTDGVMSAFDEDSDISISDVSVTVVPEGETLPDDIAQLMAEADIQEKKVEEDVISQTPQTEPAEIMDDFDVSDVSELVAVPVTEKEIAVEPVVEETPSPDVQATTIAEVVEIAQNAANNEDHQDSLDELFDDSHDLNILSVQDEMPEDRAQNLKEVVKIEETSSPESETVIEETVQTAEKTMANMERIGVSPSRRQEEKESLLKNEEEEAVESVIEEKPVIKKEEPPVKKAEIQPEQKKQTTSQDTAKQVTAKPKKQPQKKVVKKTQDKRLKDARQAMDQKDYGRAVTLYNQILSDDPGNTSALTGRQLANAGLRSVAAENEKKQAVEIKKQPTAQPQKAVIPTTIEGMTNAFFADPKNVALAYEIGEAHRKQGNKVEAREWYMKALQLDALYDTGANRLLIYDRLSQL